MSRPRRLPSTLRALAAAVVVAAGAVLPAVAVAQRPTRAVVPAPVGHVPAADDAPRATEAAPAPAGRAALAALVATPGRIGLRAAAPLEEGLAVRSSTSYVLDDDSGVVHVAFEGTIENTAAPFSSYSYSSTSYLPQYGIPMLEEAVNVAATGPDGAALPVTVEPGGHDLVSVAVVDLVPALTYGQSRTIRITYDLPPTGARTPGLLRLNRAYASFPVFAIGDAGATSIEVTVPDRFEVETIGSDIEQDEQGDVIVLRDPSLDAPDEFYIDLVARDDSELVERRVELGDRDVNVLGWPGDDEWVDFVAQQVEQGVPAFRDLLGLELPDDRDIDVIETVSPYLYGFAGWFSVDDSVIEVGDELDQETVLHELAHAWFNIDLFDGRWINEALAELYADRVIADLGGAPRSPAPVDRRAPGASSLNEWSDPLIGEVSPEADGYAYNASWAVLQQIADEVGIERVSAAMREATESNLAYAAEGRPRRHRGDHGWQQLLDLLQAQGSTTAEPLFREHVAAADDLVQMDLRAAARARYAELAATGPGWAPPAAVRIAMAQWRFDRAGTLIDGLAEQLAQRDALLAELAAVGIEVPDAVQARWEDAGSLVELDRLLQRDLDALRAVVATRDRLDVGPDGGPLGSIGVALQGLDGDVDRAFALVADGDLFGAAQLAATVDERLDEAVRSGLARLAAVLALVAVVGAMRRTGTRPPEGWTDRRKGDAKAVAELLIYRHDPHARTAGAARTARAARP